MTAVTSTFSTRNASFTSAPGMWWDVEQTTNPESDLFEIRSLEPVDRKYGPVTAHNVEDVAVAPSQFESPLERRMSIVLSTCLGLALIIGSALGGVFAGEGQGAGAASDVTRELARLP
ncbi:hypothetical protein CAPI_04805 [Corynebacterium capitovis DSM 44611]|uniref:hypothetical protein n=1 Tax=Corynebacterium capitovis TaxID=131081 RepID=UPI00037F015F|nr:hypothetical protein [Corynebacterium capitovis]WKD57519.1 hypothetical protein CAPI_04805 [Corynebacterium capitovis DSM 44611]